MDYDLWLRLSKGWDLFYMPGARAAFRTLPEAKTSLGWSKNRREALISIEAFLADRALEPRIARAAERARQRRAVEAALGVLMDDEGDEIAAALLSQSVAGERDRINWYDMQNQLMMYPPLARAWVGLERREWMTPVLARLVAMIRRLGWDRGGCMRPTVAAYHLSLALDARGRRALREAYCLAWRSLSTSPRLLSCPVTLVVLARILLGDNAVAPLLGLRSLGRTLAVRFSAMLGQERARLK
jgi:hypothetical protein